MFYVNVIKNTDNKQSNELIIKTKDKTKAELAFQGALLGVHYDLRNKKSVTEIVLNNKHTIKYDNTVITVLLREVNDGQRKRKQRHLCSSGCR